MSRKYTSSQIENASEELEVEILSEATANGYLSSSDWNEGNYDLMTLAETMHLIVDMVCPICHEETIHDMGSGTCSPSCWADLYGEQFYLKRR